MHGGAWGECSANIALIRTWMLPPTTIVYCHDCNLRIMTCKHALSRRHPTRHCHLREGTPGKGIGAAAAGGGGAREPIPRRGEGARCGGNGRTAGRRRRGRGRRHPSTSTSFASSPSPRRGANVTPPLFFFRFCRPILGCGGRANWALWNLEARSC